MAKYLDEIALVVGTVATGGALLAAYAPAALGGLGASFAAATGTTAGAGITGLVGGAGATAGTGLGTAAANASLAAESTALASGATATEAAAAGSAASGASVAGSAGGAAGAAAADVGAAGVFGTGISLEEVGAVAMIGGGYQQKVQNEAATRAQRRQNMFAGRLRDLQIRREVLGQVNSANVERASVLNRSAQTGGQGSSGESGSVSSIASQLGANVSFLDQGRQLQNDIFGQAQRAQTSSERAGMAGGVAKLGSLFGQGVFNDVFTG